MEKRSLIHRVYSLYYEGFRDMTLGRTLWLVILVKLFILFAVLKVFFFPDYLKEHAPDGDKGAVVSAELLERAAE